MTSPDDPTVSEDAPTLAVQLEQASIGGWTARLREAGGPPSGHLGRYPITGRLGAGGMGEVVSVRDCDLGREIAAKVIRGPVDGRAAGQLVLEGQITGQLEHPGIVPVYELGMSNDGRLYFTMKRVQGRTLADAIRAGLSDDRSFVARAKLLGAFLRICEAMAYAHSRGVVHRDLKPANVMVGEFGEVLVMDWGLARVAGQSDPAASGVALDLTRLGGADALRTLDGTVVGTPSYMPPEQADGRVGELGARSDVYSLGAILYEILCGRPPYEGGTVWDVLAQVAEGRLIAPGRRAPELDVPWELEAVVQKAMARAPDDRYPSVAELAADVERYLAGLTLVAARYNPVQRAGKWVWRHRAVCGAMLAVLLAAGGVGGWYRRQAALRLAFQRAETADEARRALDGLPGPSDLRAAVARTRRDEPGSSASSTSATLIALGRRLAALTALDTALRLDPDHADLRAARRDATEALGLAAVLGGDFTLAEQVMQSLSHWGTAPDRVEELRAEVDGARRWSAEAHARADERARAERRSRLESILAGVADAAARGGRRLEPHALEDMVFEVAGWREPQTVAVLQAALAPLVDRATRHGPRATWEPAEADLALLACRVLGRLGAVEGAVSVLSGWMDVAWQRDLAIEAGLALCNTRQPAAHAPLERARERFGVQSPVWSEIERYVDRLPAAPAEPASELDAEAWLRLGVGKLQRGDLEGAISAFDAVIRLEPLGGGAYLNRAAARFRQNDLTAARADLDRALEILPRNVKLRVFRADVRRRLGDQAGAREDLRHALESEPIEAQTCYERGMLREALGDAAGAIEDYGRAIQLDADLVAAYVDRGGLRLDRGQLAEALADFSRAIELDPDLAPAWYNRGIVRAIQGARREALGDYDRALFLAPNHLAARVNRGLVRQELGDAAGALEDYGEVLRLDPREQSALYNRGDLLRWLGRREAARVDLDRLLELDPRHAMGRSSRGAVRLESGDLPGALADLDLAVELDPQGATHSLRRAWVQERRKDWGAALADYDRAIGLDPRLASARLSRGKLHRRQGRLDPARDDLTRALELDPGLVEAWCERGDLNQSLGDPSAAAHDYSRALELAPDHRQALLSRGQLRQTQGDLDGAVSDLDRLLAVAPGLGEGLMARALVLRDRGELDRALADIQGACLARPQDFAVHYYAGLVREARGELGDALAAFDRALEIAPSFARGLVGRGLVHEAMGKGELARRDLDRAVELAAADPEALHVRAVLRGLAGDAAGALADMAAAASAAPQNGYYRLWVALLSDGIGSLEGVARAGDWQGALARAVLGRLTRDELLAEAERGSTAIERAQRACEAHVYLGLLAERAGRIGPALDEYRLGLATKRPELLEYVWARGRVRAAPR